MSSILVQPLALIMCPGADIWSRMTAGCYPLVSIFAAFPRPALHWKYQLLLQFICLAIASTRSANYSRSWYLVNKECFIGNNEFASLLLDLVGNVQDREWKALVIIAKAYNEWDEADIVDRVLREIL